MEIIGEYIQGLAAQAELRMNKMLRDTHLAEHAEIQAIDDEDDKQRQDDEEEPTSLRYPMSLEGMKFYMERLTFKSNTLHKTKIKSVDQLKQVVQSFKDCIGQAVFKINTMQQAAAGKIDFGAKEVKQLKKLSRRYLSSYERS